METTALYILVVLALAIFALQLWLWRKNQQPKEAAGTMLLLQEQLKEIRGTLDNKLGDSAKMFQQQFGESAKIIRDVTDRLAKLDETNRQVVGFADQLRDLQDILKNPKHRGVLGEYYLETVLKNVLPPKNYQMQYAFKNGEVVDAVVFVKDKIIPIDSKFSLENYNRILQEKDEQRKQELEKQFKNDLKLRIDETAKYIRPGENTMDFAFMFIPAEGIYYDLLINQVGAIKVNTRDLIEYAFKEKHVIIVSPTSFFAYLQTVLQGLRALQIEESAKEIRQAVEKLQKHLLSYEDYLKKLGNNLGTTVNMYNRAYKEFAKVDKDVVKITAGTSEIEPLKIDGPDKEEVL
ncbi:MAG: DNA recombination protein RmuC [Candidatus Portnoybacteria bacterium CG10_big_fil_rev_8_21_14_0_10_44_7]|uniref:DNA recombination protein RmuC n=1 Tax=Candidatus Portnoybacteria bacterium CG10_big_fil_rev_8_21_14_0_10_44_7 TaxID=1974816 RepID=A0A2M8KIA7_9BACT|nr:MAG: DNA recombination protein RmuC [Candidatus Portnoybacteria bacterium CG10_big_fil_rev_8_21_14_0_10_44_7]